MEAADERVLRRPLVSRFPGGTMMEPGSRGRDLEGTVAFEAVDCVTVRKSSFRECIRAFAVTFSTLPPGIYETSAIERDFSFQRRRLYDLINVLVAIGCCRKNTDDTIFWLGLRAVLETFKKLKESLESVNGKVDANCIIPAGHMICVSSLTVGLITCFIGQKKRVMNIKKLAALLSRKNGRFKTTLCKLYQVTHILEALGVMQKSDVTGEVVLCKEYCLDEGDIPEMKRISCLPFAFSVAAMLI
jgi:hypothetical protein